MKILILSFDIEADHEFMIMNKILPIVLQKEKEDKLTKLYYLIFHLHLSRSYSQHHRVVLNDEL
jgi:hypothetical protein